jgi:hypothetical protein
MAASLCSSTLLSISNQGGIAFMRHLILLQLIEFLVIFFLIPRGHFCLQAKEDLFTGCNVEAKLPSYGDALPAKDTSHCRSGF